MRGPARVKLHTLIGGDQKALLFFKGTADLMRFHNHWVFEPQEHDIMNGKIGFRSESYKHGIPALLHAKKVIHWKMTYDSMKNIFLLIQINVTCRLFLNMWTK